MLIYKRAQLSQDPNNNFLNFNGSELRYLCKNNFPYKRTNWNVYYDTCKILLEYVNLEVFC